MKNNNIVVVDNLWGDSGKGKVSDFILNTREINTSVRYCGGPNAGHQIFVDNNQYVMHLIPAGILKENTINVIATGVLVDPIKLRNEIEILKQRVNVTPKNLKVSSLCSVITKIHCSIDIYEENARGDNKIGTTKCGIGPTSSQKYARSGLRLLDLLNLETLKEKISSNYYKYVAQYKYGLAASYEDFIHELYDCGQYLLPYLDDTSLFLDHACRQGGVLFEGSQSALLDVDSPMTPFTTSTHCVAGYAAVGSGISSKYLDEIIGVTKAFTSKVGGGSFPTEFETDFGNYIREKGNEYGSTTQRPRRLGWLDLVAVKYSARAHGLTSLAITKLDTLSGIDELKVCTHYTINDKIVENMPLEYEFFKKAVPNYVTLKGWHKNLSELQDPSELPQAVFDYIQFIEDFVSLPVQFIGVGPNRSQTIELK